MKDLTTILLISIVFAIIQSKVNALNSNEREAESYLKDMNIKLAMETKKATEAAWKYETNITQANSEARISAAKVFNDFCKTVAFATKKFDWTHFKEYNQRQLEKMSVIGTAALNKQDFDTYSRVTDRMETIYSSAKVCIKDKCDLALDPDLTEMMAKSTDYDELSEVWVKWREASGRKMRQDFITYYTLGNKAAKLNELPNKKFSTFDDLWLFSWETHNIKELTEQIWEELKPFYQKLHAYVRIKLNAKYPGKMPKDGTIPAHLLGNMWAQSWSNLMKTVEGIDPFPNLPQIDVTPAIEKSYTTEKMFKLSEKFFVELGLDKMTDKFWKNSVFDKPKNIEMVCHASAWDYDSEQNDFRIKMCTKKTMEELITVHHEMGHIQYYMQYKNQPAIYREGANPGFHEAIGDLLALSVATPKHLKKIGLLKTSQKRSAEELEINLKFQMQMALDKLAFLPFAYIMDKYRWDVFSGKVSSKELTRHWWTLRGQYQGLSPPIRRSEYDFDPGAKYHVPANVEYIRYFASYILQFQFHKKLCSFGQKDVPLHECDIDGDVEAGKALKEMLKKGSSERWEKQLQDFTGTDRMDVQPFIEYFQPLHEFLDKELEGKDIVWKFSVNEYLSSGAPKSSPFLKISLLFLAVLVTIALTYV